MSYFLVSMKHTFKDDKFLTLWQANNCGYTLFREDCGEYKELEKGYHDSEWTLPVEKEKLDSLFEVVSLNGAIKMVILNQPHIWNQLGLELTKDGLRRVVPTNIETLSKQEKSWYNLFDAYCKKEGKKWAMPAEIKLDYDLTHGYNTLFFTKDLTEAFTKLAKKGVLCKFKVGNFTAFHYPDVTYQEVQKSMRGQ